MDWIFMRKSWERTGKIRRKKMTKMKTIFAVIFLAFVDSGAVNSTGK